MDRLSASFIDMILLPGLLRYRTVRCHNGDGFGDVVSGMMLHHLETEQKQGMLAEAWRVLKPGGSILVMDFGPVGSGMVAEGTAAVFGRFERVDDNLRGRVPEFLRAAGFVDVVMEDVAFAGVVKVYGGRKVRAEHG